MDEPEGRWHPQDPPGGEVLVLGTVRMKTVDTFLKPSGSLFFQEIIATNTSGMKATSDNHDKTALRILQHIRHVSGAQQIAAPRVASPMANQSTSVFIWSTPDKLIGHDNSWQYAMQTLTITRHFDPNASITVVTPSRLPRMALLELQRLRIRAILAEPFMGPGSTSDRLAHNHADFGARPRAMVFQRFCVYADIATTLMEPGPFLVMDGDAALFTPAQNILTAHGNWDAVAPTKRSSQFARFGSLVALRGYCEFMVDMWRAPEALWKNHYPPGTPAGGGIVARQELTDMEALDVYVHEVCPTQGLTCTVMEQDIRRHGTVPAFNLMFSMYWMFVDGRHINLCDPGVFNQHISWTAEGLPTWSLDGSVIPVLHFMGPCKLSVLPRVLARLGLKLGMSIDGNQS